MPIFQSTPAKRTLICQKKILYKKLIKPPFDAEVAEKFLNGIYYAGIWNKDSDFFFTFFLQIHIQCMTSFTTNRFILDFIVFITEKMWKRNETSFFL